MPWHDDYSLRQAGASHSGCHGPSSCAHWHATTEGAADHSDASLASQRPGIEAISSVVGPGQGGKLCAILSGLSSMCMSHRLLTVRTDDQLTARSK